MRTVSYESKSTSPWLYVIAGVIGMGGLVMAVVFGIALRPEAFFGLLMIAFAFFIANFAVLTVRVSEDQVAWSFGGGRIGRKLAIERIQAVEARKTPWYWGWGIRLTPSGWLWRSHGLDAVWLGYDDGKQTGIGTQDPKGLLRAVNLALEVRTK